MTKNDLIINITKEMSTKLSSIQLEVLKKVLIDNFNKIDVLTSKSDFEKQKDKNINKKYIDLFISAKEVEGCSKRTLNYYRNIVDSLVVAINKEIKNIETNDIRLYLSDFKENHNCTAVTIDNIRRVLSSFFSWLEDEDYIIKSPVRRIHKVKTTQNIKETFSDENLEKMRDNCSCTRDLAIVEILFSTGMRVGELVNLNISDVNIENRSCIVLGKGNKQREVYFDARTKLHLIEYLKQRKDNNNALFVSKNSPNQRLSISGIELIVRKIGGKANLNNVYPHKFRRTLATIAIDKGMPIEQVQKLLGHVKIETTMTYAIVNQNNVKISHRKYLS